MTRSWTRARHEVAQTLETLAAIMDDEEADNRRLVTAYLTAKQELAEAFQLFAKETFPPSLSFDELLIRLEQHAASLSIGVPMSFRRARASSTHKSIYAYLAAHVGRPVPASELRILTGDAVHTERRARELRDYGLRVNTVLADGHSGYELVSTEVDVDSGARLMVRSNVLADRSLAPETKQFYLDELK